MANPVCPMCLQVVVPRHGVGASEPDRLVNAHIDANCPDENARGVTGLAGTGEQQDTIQQNRQQDQSQQQILPEGQQQQQQQQLLETQPDLLDIAPQTEPAPPHERPSLYQRMRNLSISSTSSSTADASAMAAASTTPAATGNLFNRNKNIIKQLQHATREPHYSNPQRCAAFLFCFVTLKERRTKDPTTVLVLSDLPLDVLRLVVGFVDRLSVDFSRVRQLHKMTDHGAYVWSIAANDDLIVSGGGDNMVRIWDWDGKSLQVCGGHRNSVRSIAITNPDEFPRAFYSKRWATDRLVIEQQLPSHTCPVRVVSGGDDRTVRVWHPTTGACLAAFDAHEGSVLACAAADIWLVTGSSDNVLKVWEYDGTLLRTLSGHTNDVYSCCVLNFNSRSRVVSGSFDGTARVWDPLSGDALLELCGDGDQIYGVGANLDYILTSSQNSSIRVWNWKGELLRTLTGHQRTVRSVCFAGRDHVISGSWDTNIRVWDLAKPPGAECILTLNAHSDWIKIVVFARDRFASCSDDNSVRIFGEDRDKER